MYINVNGIVSFNGPQIGPQGAYYYQLPNSNLAYLAPFWADFDVANIGNITYTYNSTYVNITWNQVPCYTNNNSTAQLDTVSLIMTNDGKFAFIYGDMQWKNDPNNSYPSLAIINKGDYGTTQEIFWDGSQDLSTISNKTIWFDSNGNLTTPELL
jgi:hypothetical protein